MRRRPDLSLVPRFHGPKVRAAVSGTLVAACLAASSGCSSPLAIQTERDLRRSVIETTRRELAEAQKSPARQETLREPGVARLGIEPRLMPDLERMAGPQSYDPSSIELDANLLGGTQNTVTLTLERAIRTAAVNNLSIQFARLQPAISESQVVAAEAAFDFTLFSNIDWQSTDSPRVQSLQGGALSGPSLDERRTLNTSTGLRRPLASGGTLTFQQDLNKSDVSTPGFGQRPNPADDLAYVLRVDQPLLRNFGSDVATSQIRLSRNAERDQISQLKRDMIRTLTQTEQAYWTLARAQRELLILQRLYTRGIAVREQVLARGILDATPAQKADARARVERRRADVIRAQNQLLQASDALKVLLNDPELPVGGETLILPGDEAVDAPVSFALSDILASAIQNRPELQQAILSIDNTSIRQVVADNARLPRLDLRLQARFAGLDQDFNSAFDQVRDREFIDYLVGIQFEQPLGNRAAEALYRQRRLERQQATIAYRNAVQQVLQECKRALRDVVSGYRLIEQTRVSRLAETENLRSFEVEKQVVRGYDVNSLDLEFRRQEALASAEREEIQALSDYQIAIAQLYQAMGTALERNNIEFKVPIASEPLDSGGLAQPRNPVTPPKPELPTQTPPRPAPPWAPANR